MDIFDIIGPVMIGPSSSHTAGAARIGRAAANLLGYTPAKAKIAIISSVTASDPFCFCIKKHLPYIVWKVALHYFKIIL